LFGTKEKMRKDHKFGESTRTLWRAALLVVLLGVLVAIFALELGGPSATANKSAVATSFHSRSTTTKGTENTTAKTADTFYSGGQLMAADPKGGYWTVNWLGAVAAHGGAPSFGSPVLSGLKVSKPIIGMAATPDGQGYWLVGSDGGVFTYGDATFFGSAGAMPLNQPIIGMTATPDGQGYWLVGSDGGVFTYGDARFYGSAGTLPLSQPVIGMAATPDGQGYWLVGTDGGVFTYGDAKFRGTLGTGGPGVIGIIVSTTTSDYDLVQSDGTTIAPTLTPTPAVRTTTPAPTSTSTTTGAAGVAANPSHAVAPAPPARAPAAVPAPAPTPAPITTEPSPAASSGGGGTCNGTSNPTPPTASTYSGYSLQNAMTGPQIVNDAGEDGYTNYAAGGPLVAAPDGWLEASHIVVTNNALEELGYSDPAHPGVTGAGMNIANDKVNSYGGFTYCFSLSGSNWQNVAVVFIAWPADNVWQEGEIDFLAGTPQQAGIDVFQVGGCSSNCNVTWQSQWPASVGSGLHEATVLWNPTTGDSFYLDGKLVASVPPSGTVGIPSTPHIPTMQIQDMGENSSVPASSPLTASLYWVATFSYNQ
jgi:hypothetical protein